MMQKVINLVRISCTLQLLGYIIILATTQLIESLARWIFEMREELYSFSQEDILAAKTPEMLVFHHTD